MSGFSPQWLALREPADYLARDARVLGTCCEHFGGAESLRIVDLGCGSGSNLRAISPHLAPRQFWQLADHDPRLLAAAREALRNWADVAQDNGPNLLLEKAGKTLHVEFCQVDLALNLESLLVEGTDLVTAAALFDLCSQAWISRFVDQLAARKLNFYTALTYNGEERWLPPHEDDAAILAAFAAHQKTDKGFGVSAGPEASDCLIQHLRRHNYGIAIGDSPWQLGPGEVALIAALAQGSAAAALETGQVTKTQTQAWLSARIHAQSCQIGHTDLFACTF